MDRTLDGLLLVSLCGLYLFTAQSGNAFTTYLVPILLIAGWPRYRAELRQLLGDPLYLGVCVLLAYLGASALWSPAATPTDVLKALSRVLFIVAYVSATVLSIRRDRRFVFASVLGVALAASASTLLAAGFEHTDRGRLIGWGDLDRAVMAGLAWGAASLLAVWLIARDAAGATWPSLTVRRTIGAIAATLAFAAMLESGSRAAWIGYGVAIATLSVLVSNRRAIVSIVWLAVGVALIAWFASDAEVQRWLLPRGDSFRPAIWSSTFDAVRHGHWLFGAGMLAHHTSIQGGYVIAHPHSVYLATLFHGGIVAAALLLGVLLLALVRGFRWRTDWVARAAVTLLAFAVPALALDGSALIDKVGYLWLLLWTPLAWLIALGRPTPAPHLR